MRRAAAAVVIASLPWLVQAPSPSTARAQALQKPPRMLPAQISAKARTVHGENAVFSTDGLALAWAVLRGASEEATQVVIRLVVEPSRYGHVTVDGVDPFGGARRTLLPGTAVTTTLDVRSPRATFAELPRREIHLYATADDWQRGAPALTVYYVGVPDTAPEFDSEPALAAYLDDALRRARRP